MIVGDVVRTKDGREGPIVKVQRQSRGFRSLIFWVEVAPGEAHAFAEDTLTHVRQHGPIEARLRQGADGGKR